MPPKSQPKSTQSVPAAERKRRQAQSRRDKAAARGTLKAARFEQQGKGAARNAAVYKQMYRRDLGQAALGGARQRRLAAADMLAYPFDHQVRLPYSTIPTPSALQKWRTVKQMSMNIVHGATPSYETGSMQLALIGLPGLLWANSKVVGGTGGQIMYAATFGGAAANAKSGGAEEDTIEECIGEAWNADTNSLLIAQSDPRYMLMTGPRTLEIESLDIFQGPAYTGGMERIHGECMPLGVSRGDKWIYMESQDALMLKVTVGVNLGSKLTAAKTTTYKYHVSATFDIQRWNPERGESFAPDRQVLVWWLDDGTVIPIGGTTYTRTGYLTLTTKSNPKAPVDEESGKAGFYRVVLSNVEIGSNSQDNLAANEFLGLYPRVTDFKVGMKLCITANLKGSLFDTQWNDTGVITEAEAKAIYDGTTAYTSTGLLAHWCLNSSGTIQPTEGGDRLIGEHARCVAASLLFSNTTAPINKAGSIFATRIRAGEARSGTDTTDLAFYNLAKEVLLTSKFFQRLDGQTGAFTFMLPDEERSAFESASEKDNGIYFDLERMHKTWYYFLHYVPSGSANTFDVTVDHVIEFATNSQRYQIGVPKMTLEDFHSACSSLLDGSVHHWYENPTHVSRVFAFLRRAVENTTTYIKDRAPQIAAGLSAYNPAWAPYAALFAQALR